MTNFSVVRQRTDTRSSAMLRVFLLPVNALTHEVQQYTRILSVSRTIEMTPDIHYIKVQKAQLITFQFREDV